MEIGSGPPIQVQIDALNKATDVQEQTVTRLLDDSAKQLQEQQKVVEDTQQTSGSTLTGIGTGLDVTA